MQVALELTKIFLSALTGWLVLGGYFALAEKWPRLLFVVTHYMLSLITFVVVSLIYVKYLRGSGFTPFQTMAYFMVSLFTIEILFFKFVYTQPLWFLNFTDWIVPVFIVATSVYLTVEYLIQS